MHVLRVAGILDCYCIIVDGVGVVPFAYVCHVVALFLPSGEYRLPPRERLFDEVNCLSRIEYILLHELF